MAKKPDFIRFFALRENGSFFGSRRERHLSNPLSYNVFCWDSPSNPTVSVEKRPSSSGARSLFHLVQRWDSNKEQSKRGSAQRATRPERRQSRRWESHRLRGKQERCLWHLSILSPDLRPMFLQVIRKQLSF